MKILPGINIIIITLIKATAVPCDSCLAKACDPNKLHSYLCSCLTAAVVKMVRRIASQVHKQAARLMRANYIKNEPVWFKAVLEHPPLPLPPRAPPVREDCRLPSSRKMRKPKTEPLPIFYLEDKVRRQFFRDHPFEAFRPVSIVEGREVEDEHPIRGTDWTRLAQRGLNPSPEE